MVFVPTSENIILNSKISHNHPPKTHMIPPIPNHRPMRVVGVEERRAAHGRVAGIGKGVGGHGLRLSLAKMFLNF